MTVTYFGFNPLMAPQRGPRPTGVAARPQVPPYVPWRPRKHRTLHRDRDELVFGTATSLAPAFEAARHVRCTLARQRRNPA
jgi:hypothetical protein